MDSQLGESNVETVIKNARLEGRKFLMEHEAKEVLKAYNIPVTREKVAADINDAVEAAEEIGFPVVLKVYSPDIIHKSDVGGVIVGLETPSEVIDAYKKITENVKANMPEARILGVLVQEMAPRGYEVIVGAIRDVQFGPAVMFGLGGLFTEVFKDVSFRLAPLNREEALEMMREVRSFKILEGFRGQKPANLDSIAEVIIRVGEVIIDLSEVAEIDINPLVVNDRGSIAVDARIILT